MTAYRSQTATMKCSTAGLRRGDTVTILHEDDPFLTVTDAAGREHLILSGDVTNKKETST